MSITAENQETKLKNILPQVWLDAIGAEFDKDYMLKLRSFLADEVKQYRIFPASNDTFNAFRYCPLDQVKVVILGQDPYHGPGQAHGLCFSVQDGVAFPPSLVNIFKEILRDLGISKPSSGNLERWARQGVFLLNTVLSVRSGQANSHAGQGWEIFTDKVIQTINDRCEHVVFMLWGAPARRKAEMIDRSKHLILEAPHPSPLSAHRGFIGCGHFGEANRYLQEHGQASISW